MRSGEIRAGLVGTQSMQLHLLEGKLLTCEGSVGRSSEGSVPLEEVFVRDGGEAHEARSSGVRFKV